MHIGIICPEYPGHLNPMGTLGQELLRRGHRVSIVGTPDAQAKAVACGFGLYPIGVAEHRSGEMKAEADRLGDLKGIAAFRHTVRMFRRGTELFLRDAAEQLRASGVDGLLIDQVSSAGTAVADLLKLPYVLVSNALAVHMEPGVPPCFFPWRYREDFLARMRNRIGNAFVRNAAKPIFNLINVYRKSHGLPPTRYADRNEVGLAQIAQQPEFFDFPHRHLPSHFHYTGPFHGPQRDTESAPFPWEKLDGRPLIYASLGTVQNRLSTIFQAILDGCAHMDVQVVLSLGRKDASWNLPTPANAIVVPFAPQLRLLARASLLITHAGLNTALEGLSCGLPMLCIPITNDQPGVARRVEFLGAGEVLKPSRVTAERIREIASKLLREESYRASAAKCSERLKLNPGVVRAADLAEKALSTRKRLER